MPNMTIEEPQAAGTRAELAQRYARIAGALFLVSLVAGGFGEAYVPSRAIVSGDAAATARNIMASAWLFRLGFAGYLVEAVCDVALTAFLYLLLKPARKDVALLAVFFRLMGTATFAFGELFYYAALPILGGAAYLKTFSPEQLNALALLSLKLYGAGGGLFAVFYGIGSMLLGYLIFRSGFLPKWLGVLLALGGVGFVISSFALVLAPRYASPVLFLPTLVAALSLTLWLLVKGVDGKKWEDKALS